MLFNVPIEPLEERYSIDWNNWIESFFLKSKGDFQFKTIFGDPLTNKIEHGSFLDVCGTNYYKASQLQKIAKLIYDGKVKDGDIFFFHDLWFPGLEMLAYMRDGLGIDFKITGILHAGTWDEWDFLSQKHMEYWAFKIEEGWFNLVNAIFVATEYHRKLILSKRAVGACKIYATGLPIYNREGQDGLLSKPFWDEKKENIIVFPHRLDPEKQPGFFDELGKDLKKRSETFKDWQFIKTKDVCRDKQEYYDLLRRSKIAVSFATQETWGIAMQEALFAGCVPVVPNRLSYPEMYNAGLIYNDGIAHAEELLLKVVAASSRYCSYASADRLTLLERGAKALPTIFSILQRIGNVK